MPKPKSDLLTAAMAFGFLLLGALVSVVYIYHWSYEEADSEVFGFVIEEQEQGILLKRLPDMAEQFIGGEWDYVGSGKGNLIVYQENKEIIQLHHITPEQIDILEYPSRDFPLERVAFSKDNEWFFMEWPTDKGYLYCMLSAWDIKKQDCNSFELQGDGRLYWSALDSSAFVKELSDGSQIAYKVGQAGNSRGSQPLLKEQVTNPSLPLKFSWWRKGKLLPTSVPGQYYLNGKNTTGILDTVLKRVVIF